MNKLEKLFLTFGLASSVFSSGLSQNFVEGCNYIRKIKVNTVDSLYNVKKDSGEKTFYYDGFKEPIGDEAKNSLEGKSLNVYFYNDDSKLTDNDVHDIRKYFSEVLVPLERENKIKNVVVEGYANFLGSDEHNYLLSLERAENVAEIVKQKLYCYFPYPINVRISAFGEKKSLETNDSLQIRKDRKVKISVQENPFKEGLEYLGGDVFLLDQSGSMRDGSWRFLQNYKFPEAKGYFSFSQPVEDKRFSTVDFLKRDYSYDINLDKEGGRTSFYSATDLLLKSDFIDKKDTLTVIINGRDNVGKVSVDKVIEDANEKDVVVNILGINIDDEYARTLMDITSKTNGNYYFITKSFSSKVF